jgi:hypothetical protein
MKKIFLSLLLVLGYSVFSQNASRVFTSDSLVFYGVDFSNCRLIGDFGLGGGADMKNKMFVQWNEIFVKEAPKYDLPKTFRKKTVIYDMNSVAAQNAKTDENLILSSNNDFVLDPALIPKMVAAYSMGEIKKGTGLVFIVDNYNKNKEQGLVYVTFFDIASKKVLFSEELKGKPGGFGLRNYWARVIHMIMKDIDDSYYFKWKEMYGAKK